jgi:hypothetical protein
MEMTAKVPVWQTAAGSYLFVRGHMRDLARIGWLPLAALVAISLVFGIFEPVDGASRALPTVAGGLLGSLLQGAVAAIVLVAWHRVALLDGSPPPLAPGRRDGAYFLRMLVLSLLFLLVWVLTFLAAEIILIGGHFLWTGGAPATAADAGDTAYVVLGYMAAVAGLVPAFYLALRLSLTLPATALDRSATFAQAWAASRGNGWRMTVATILALLPVDAAVLVLGMLAAGSSRTLLYYPLVLLACAGRLLLMAVLGTTLSRCYALLQRQDGEAAFADGAAAPAR